MNDRITDRITELRYRQAQRAAVDQAIDELILDGLIEWTGQYRDGRPVYVATELGRQAGA